MRAHGVRVLGIEFFRRDVTYRDWAVQEGGRDFQRITLCAETLGEGTTHRRAAAELGAVLRREQPDAVAIPGWILPECRVALRWCERHGRKPILMSDSREEDYPRRWWKETWKRRFVRRFSAALVAGRPHRDYVVKLGLSPDRVFSGYDVVDNEFYRQRSQAVRRAAAAIRAERSLPERYFLATARFIPEKNLEGLIRAYAGYCGTVGTDRAWHLVICGSGPRESEIVKLARDLKAERVVWAGFVQPEEMPVYYGLASAFILASRKDSWGLAVNEAMACGLPVLVSRRAGCATDLVRDGENGFLLEPASPGQMTEAMARMAGLSAEDRERMGKRSLEIVAGWGIERFAEGLWAAVGTPLPGEAVAR
jgi:glycosyltransferase involved in cell wall biosynthesis